MTNALAGAISFALVELPRIERRISRLLKKSDMRLVRQGFEYVAVSRTTASVEFGPANIDVMVGYAEGRAR